ncbi:MAG: AraC family transcriptional regulator [Oscillospiraceae bacterium]|nr:AraC family transcriptional regulator [Oscillospiraceae bacterium]
MTNNNPPTKIYLDCGYRDYASFYRAFVKMFGYPPSQTKPD